MAGFRPLEVIQIQIAKCLAQVDIIMTQVGQVTMCAKSVIQPVALAQVIQVQHVQDAKVAGI